MWCLGTQFTGGLGSPKVGPDDLTSLCKCNDSMTL